MRVACRPHPVADHLHGMRRADRMVLLFVRFDQKCEQVEAIRFSRALLRLVVEELLDFARSAGSGRWRRQARADVGDSRRSRIDAAMEHAVAAACRSDAVTQDGPARSSWRASTIVALRALRRLHGRHPAATSGTCRAATHPRVPAASRPGSGSGDFLLRRCAGWRSAYANACPVADSSSRDSAHSPRVLAQRIHGRSRALAELPRDGARSSRPARVAGALPPAGGGRRRLHRLQEQPARPFPTC